MSASCACRRSTAELVRNRLARAVGVLLPVGHRLAGRAEIALSELRDDDHVFLRLRDSGFALYLRGCCVEAGFMAAHHPAGGRGLFADEPGGGGLRGGAGPAQHQRVEAA